MKNLFILLILVATLVTTSCKNEEENPLNNSTVQDVLVDFADVLVFPNYQDIEANALMLNNAIQELIAATTDEKLSVAQELWRSTRRPWEMSEAYLFGPVEDFNYDPTLDTWPVNRVDLDSILASDNPLSVQDVELLPTSLKGFHAIEYLLFGESGKKAAADFTSREFIYLEALSDNLLTTTTALRLSWDITQPDNFTNELINAGKSGSRYASNQDVLMTIVSAMAGICDEVANGKMEEPLLAQDSMLEESQFSHNSTADFRNNIIGVMNSYLCKYFSDGHGLNELVAARNIALDNVLQAKMNAAINAFDAIDENYGKAIFTQQVQIHNAQNAINSLRETIETDLMNFIITTIKD